MPAKPKKNGRQNYDWAKIKHDYVTTPDASLRKIAKKYGVSENAIYKKSKADSWFASRQKHQADVVAKAIAQTGIKQADELAKSVEYLHSLSAQVGEMLEDKEQFKKHFLQDESLAVKETVTTKYDTKAMKDSLQMVGMIENLWRSLQSIQKLEALQKYEIDKERLQLEREKFEWEKQKAEAFKPTDSNAIRIEGFEKEWSE